MSESQGSFHAAMERVLDYDAHLVEEMISTMVLTLRDRSIDLGFHFSKSAIKSFISTILESEMYLRYPQFLREYIDFCVLKRYYDLMKYVEVFNSRDSEA